LARWIAGLDGCRGAWAGVLLDLDDPARHRAGLFATVAEVLDGAEAPACAGIDIPIGLPERSIGGGRSADRAARALLGPRGSASVFPVPPRAALYAPDYETAKALARRDSDPPRAFSIQCWNIAPSIRAVDGLLRSRPDLRARLHEVHPEIAFRCLNGGRPLAAGKKGAERRAGLAARRELLLAAGLPEALVLAPPPRGVGPDDHVDAMAGLVVARDILTGRARPLPDPFERDAHGLPVVIWAPGERPPGSC
jgi:predicted RNase H-like nuclease